MSSTIEFLLVEDNPGDVRLIEEALRDVPETEYQIDTASRLDEAHDKLDANTFEALLLDLNLPDSGAQNTIDQIESESLSGDLPVIVLTGSRDQQLIQRALESGAQDYLLKGEISGPLLSRALRYAIERHRTQRQLKQSQQHYRSLFEDSPVAEFVEDFSEVKQYIDGLREEGVSDFRSYFEDHPEEVKHCARLIRTIEANEACQQLYRAGDKSEVMNCVDELYMEGSWSDFRDELLRYVEGHDFFTGETVQRTFDNSRVHVYLKSRLAPGAEGDWSRIYVSMVDITERVKAEQHLSQRTEQLNERLKELKCLQEVSRILENRSGSVPRLIQEFVEVIPTGYRYPEQTSVRVTLDEVTVTSPGFSSAGSAQRRDITQNGNVVGKIEVFRDPGDQEYAFTDEEEDLIDEIASRLEAVHERNRAEANLRESEQRFRQMAENINQVFWLMTYDEFEMIYVSPAFEDVFGRPVKTLYEDPDLWMECVHEEDREELHHRFPEDFDDVEYRVVRPDGDVRWLHEQAVPVLNDEGDLYRIAGVAEDITERKQAQMELAESERRFQQLVTNIDEVYWMYSRDLSETLYVSPGYEQMFGLPREGLEQNPLAFMEAVKQEDRRRIEERIQTHFRNLQRPSYVSTPGNIEYRIEVDRNLEGTGTRWLLTRTFPVKDETGHLVGIAGVTKDITERKLAERRLAESEERFRQMAENIDEVFWMFNQEFTELIYMSPQYEELSGQGIERLEENAQAFFEIIHPEDQSLITEAMEKLMQGEEVLDLEHRYVHKETGRIRWMHTEGFPVKNDQGEIYRITGFTKNITERKLAQTQLAESEERFRLMAENIEDVFYMHAEDFSEVLYMNSAFETVWGLKRQEVYDHPMKWFEFIHPKDRNEVETRLERAIERDFTEPFTLTYRIVRPEDEVRWIQATNYPILNEEGERTRIVGLAQDITERKQAEFELAESEQRFRRMAENIEGAFWIYDRSFEELIYMSPGYREVFRGIEDDPHEHPRAFLEFIHPDDRERMQEAIKRIQQHGQSVDLEYRIVLDSGKTRWVASQASPIRNEQGEIFQIAGITRDISQRKSAEIKLAESEERFRQMAENTDEVIWMSSPDLSQLEYINPAFENIFGIPPEAVLEDPYAFWSQVPDDEKPHVEESLEQFSRLEQGEKSDFEWRIKHPEKGVRWLWTRGFPVCNDEGEVIHITGFTRDITELNRTMDNLEQTIEEKETLLREVHHRVRNNLQVISSLLGLQRRKTTDPALSDLLLNSKSRVHAMALIHKRLYESGTFTDINFQEYVEDLTHDIVDFNRNEGLDLSTRVDVDETDLDFDTIVPCGLIINELVTNSIKHAFERRSEGTVSITFLQNEQQTYELEVSDDGQGWQVDHSFRESSSLGLNLVVNLVENQLHGEIEQYQDDGTTYRITFPPVKKRFETEDE